VACLGTSHCNTCQSSSSTAIKSVIGNIHITQCQISPIEYCEFSTCANPIFNLLPRKAPKEIAVIKCKNNNIHIFSRVKDSEEPALNRALNVRDLLISNCVSSTILTYCIVLVYPIVFPSMNKSIITNLFHKRCAYNNCSDGLKFFQIDTNNNIKCDF